MILHRKGEFDKAKEALEKIPASERTGDLALTPYLLADCLIRLAPVQIDDAIAVGRLEEHLKPAAELLDAYLGNNAKSPQAPDALIKIGHCYQRLAAPIAVPAERNKVLANARAAYERLIKEFPQDPLMPQAVFERAKVIALSYNQPPERPGAVNAAINELRRFTTDPLRNTSIAPMAVLRLSLLLREVNNPAEAVKVLTECRQQHEGSLQKDPARAAWVLLLQYHQGVALREAGKLGEARALFDQVIKQGGTRPEALDAILRFGQALQQEGLLQIEAASKQLATPNLKPEQVQAANQALEAGRKMVRDAVGYFETQAEQLKQKVPASDVRARLHYEAAWGHRRLAEPEVAAVRDKLRAERLKKAQDEAIKRNPAGKPPAIVAVPEVALKDVPLQASEQKARANYQALIAAFPDLPLASDARFELAELHLQREEYDPAVKLLNEAIDKEPPLELTEKIRLLLGSCYAAKKDVKAALAQFDAVAANAKSPPAIQGQGHYRAGECLFALGDFAGAAKRLAIFRDAPPFQNLPGLSDRALLRLGHALARAGQWDASRQAHEILTQRFPGSPWIHEARYGIGWAWQNAKQYDQAVNAYGQVTAATATELGARAQLQIGLCRLDQKRFDEAARALLVVPFTYDYPELSAVALCEAARTFTELKDLAQAEKLLQRVIKDHPHSEWAKVARDRLEALKKNAG
jgi:TolA-binding protein